MQTTQHSSMQHSQTPQDGQNVQNNNITINNHQMTAPDETSYNMPPDTGAPTGGSWVYGDPNLNYNGQPPSNGVSLYTMHGSSPEDAMPVPLPGMDGGLQPSGVSGSEAQSQRMKNPVDMESTHMPSSNAEAYQASLRSLLDRNVGYFVVVSFLVGTQQTITWQGILHTVGSDYIVLYQPDYERYISCDFYSIKFVQFHNVKGVPYCAASRTWQGQSGV